MRIVHVSDGETTTLAEDARIAEGRLAQGRGLMFRRSFPGDALVFPFDDVGTRRLHMVFVPFSIDAVWVADGRVQQVTRLESWIGYGRGRADCVIELPAGRAATVEAGDGVCLEE